MTEVATPAAVPLEEGTVAISDLHLDPESLEKSVGFIDWIEKLDVPRLLVLGDLFDYWVGPFHLAKEGARAVVAGLRALTGRGTRLELLRGNRDFLLEERFERASGATVHPEGLLGDLEGGERVLFLHGDELCTRDLAYQRLRRVTHSRWLQALGPRLPHWASGRIARRLRRASVRAVAAKLPEEKALQADACREAARGAGAATVVCGHAHVPRDERLEGGPRWIVLGAFAGDRDLLRVGVGGDLVLERSGARWSP